MLEIAPSKQRQGGAFTLNGRDSLSTAMPHPRPCPFSGEKSPTTSHHHRGPLTVAILGAITLVLGTAAGFLWLERERLLTDATGFAVHDAERLVTDLQQSLTVARTAIDRFNTQVQAASSRPFETPAVQLAQSQTELLAALPLPFELRAIRSNNSKIAPVGPPDKRADPQTEALGLLNETATAQPVGVWETPWGCPTTV